MQVNRKTSKEREGETNNESLGGGEEVKNKPLFSRHQATSFAPLSDSCWRAKCRSSAVYPQA